MKQKKNLPAAAPWYLVVTPEVFDAIKYAKNSAGQFVNLNSLIQLATQVWVPSRPKQSASRA